MKGYFISANNMVDPSRVYCKKCGAQAEEKGGTWFATSGSDKPVELVSKHNLCPDCLEAILLAAVNLAAVN
jgi:ribosomal protein S27AE